MLTSLSLFSRLCLRAGGNISHASTLLRQCHSAKLHRRLFLCCDTTSLGLWCR